MRWFLILPRLGARLYWMAALRQKRSFNKHPFCELIGLCKIGFASPHFASDWLDAHRDLWRRWMQEWNGEKRLIKSGDMIWTRGVKHRHRATDRPVAAYRSLSTGRRNRWKSGSSHNCESLPCVSSRNVRRTARIGIACREE
jgi:hypothetical protein